MRFSKSLRLLFFTALAIAGFRAHSQVIANQVPSSTIYVDSVRGSDVVANVATAGTTTAPLQTIQAAINVANTRNQQKIGTTIVVNPGVYRESINIGPVSGGSAAPLAIQASTTGSTIVSGSDVLTGWQPVSGHSGTYWHSWTYNFGVCPIPSGWPTAIPTIARRTEMVFVNNGPLTQVLAESQLRPGTFYVDEAANQILITPPSGTSVSTSKIEAAVRPQIFTLAGRSNVTVKGMIFEHANSCINKAAATIASNSNVVVDGVQAIWNNWGGLALSGNRTLTVKNSIASHNGGVGFLGDQDVNTTFSYTESDFNNWRGAEGAFYNWGMGGTKLFQMHTATVQYHYSYGNQAQGLWFDTDNKNITVNNATVAGSAMSALQLEANEGPLTVENSHFCTSLAGVTTLNQEKLTMKYNSFYSNGGFGQYDGQIFIAGRAGGHVIYDWQTGQYYDLRTSGTVLTSNNFLASTSGQHVFGTYLSGSDWSDFANSLVASGNHWYNQGTAYSFGLPSGHMVNFAGWKSAVGTDYSSYWALTSASSGCGIPAQTYTDFAVNLDRETYSMSAGHVSIGVRVANFGYGTVNLSVSGLPSNVSASISKSSLSSGIVSVSISATKYAANKTVPITIWGISGSRVHPVTVNVHIVPA
jgi:Right handed beta helix region